MKTHSTHCVLKLLLLSVCMKVVPVCLCAMHMAAAGREQKVSVTSPELECKLLGIKSGLQEQVSSTAEPPLQTLLFSWPSNIPLQ